ncbi:EamA family transporter [Methylobacterium persicinum]|uniref:Inner membrane transporter RhtA n=1 Tax=Methylobacterium persicinum TaxID=374426 RepID=A0ABU0HFF0_9HYPH|nr:DMT family transporter [Methylobacterium persicinum]MDQ0441050.1 inner membrane transporter RhtA [Methylobacterium persicinum]GJE40057.1 Threonine/homoserine exporter RhtA [Methylobacterium persicinum]
MRRPDHALALPIAALLTGMVSLQGGAAIAKSLFPAIGAAGTASLRVGFSALVLLAVWRPWRRSLSTREAGWIALYGAALGAMNLLFYLSLTRLPIGPAVAVEFTGPLLLAVAGSRRPTDFAWIALAVLGLGLLLPLGGAGGLDPLGIALALAAGVAWALYILFGQRAGRADGGQAVAFGMLVAALVVAPVGVAEAGTVLFAPATLALGFAVALLSSALPYSLEMVALRRLDRTSFGVLMSLEPAVAALLAYALIGEALTPVQWLAIALVIAASAGITATGRPRTAPTSLPEPATRR